MEELYRIASSALLYSSGDLFHRLVGFFYRIVISRLGKEEYGLFSLGMAISLTVSIIALLGINIGLIQFISYYKSKNDPQKVKETIYGAIKISAISGLIFSSLLYLFSGTISQVIFHNKELIKILRLFSLAIPLSVISTVFLSIPVALQKIKYLVYTRHFLESLIKIILATIFVILGLGLFWVASSFVITQVICFFLSFYFLQRVYPIRINGVFNAEIKWDIIRYSLPVSWISLSWVLFVWTDTLMLGALASSAATGLYNAAVPFVWLLLIIPVAFNSVFLPVIIGLHAQSKDIKNIYTAVERWVLTSNLPLSILLFVFSEEIISIFFGKAYITAQNTLKILCIGYLVSSLNFSKNNLLLMLKKTALILALKIIVVIINIVLNFYLIPIFGMEGAALATCLSLISQSILLEFISFKVTGIHFLTRDYLRPIIPAGISLWLIQIINSVPLVKEWGSFYRVISGSILFLGFYTVGLIIFKVIKEEDRIIFKNLANRISGDLTAKTETILFQ